MARLFRVITRPRDRALFLMMLRCGLRVAEAAALELKDLDLRRRAVSLREAKGRSGRMVYPSDEVVEALVAYLPARLTFGPGPVFLNEKGPWKGQGISVRGIQELLGHRWITTTQRYCRASNRQVKRAYFRAMGNIETNDPLSWLAPIASWRQPPVGIHSLGGHPGP